MEGVVYQSAARIADARIGDREVQIRPCNATHAHGTSAGPA